MTTESSCRAGFAGILALAAAAVAASAGSAAAAATPIKHCQTISAAGYYKVANNLTYAGISECLLITASNVVINFNSFNLTGPGSATGIRILGNNVLIEANDTLISDFAIGIEDDGNNAVVENFAANLNSDTGVFVNAASGSTFAGFGAGNNTNHGIHLHNASGIMIHNFGASNNGKYGLWAENSSHNVFNNFEVDSNGIAGTYFGCSATGPIGAGCAGSHSSNNIVLSAGMKSNSGYGMAIDFDSLANVISGAAETSNTTDDAYDGNATCGTNLWFNQNHSTSNQPSGCTNE